MYEAIDDYIDALVTELNKSANPNLKKSPMIEPILQQENYTYQLFLSKAPREDEESEGAYKVSGVIKLYFDIPNKEIDTYETLVDSYVFALANYLKDTDPVGYSYRSGTDGCTIQNIDSVEIIDLDKFEDSVFVPKIEFAMRVS
jgi:hypothetical protein